jgi:hypothetical protein
MLHTTLQLCKEKSACPEGFKNLKKSLGKDHSKTDLIPLTHIIESNGLQDALWALRATVEDSDYLAREFAIFCARQSLPIYEAKHPEDSRVRDCIDASERYNNKEITLEELWVFRKAADAVASAAVASAAVESAAESAAEAAYWAAYWTSRTSVADSVSIPIWMDFSATNAERDKQTLKLTELLNNHKEN